MKRIYGLAIAISTLVLLPGCFWNKEEKPEMKTGLVVINVLDSDTYADCHIAGSINIPFENLESSMDTIDKNAEIIFYCSNPMCTASEYAAEQFQKAGFTNVAVYHGGTAEWHQKGLPTEGAACANYLRMPVNPIADETFGGKVVTIEELAQKLGVAMPETATKVEAVELGEQCMQAHIAPAVEIPAQK